MFRSFNKARKKHKINLNGYVIVTPTSIYNMSDWIASIQSDESKSFTINIENIDDKDIAKFIYRPSHIKEELKSQWGDVSNIKFIKPRERK